MDPIITNIVATVAITLSTNVVERVTEYHHYVPTACPDGILGCAVNHTKGVYPIAKNIATNTVETTTLTFEWYGKNVIKTEKILSTVFQDIRLVWSSDTNGVPVKSQGYSWDSCILPYSK